MTFGSVGDIIAVCLLVKDLVDALDKSSGSKAEYQSLIEELRILDRALLEIEQFSRNQTGTPELTSVCQTAKEAVDRCKESVTEFSQKIRKYKGALGGPSTCSKSFQLFQEATMAVRWHMGDRDTMEKFRAEVAGISSSLQMLLATASVCVSDFLILTFQSH